MIHDLNQADRAIELRTAVCIVGGGTAGLYLADALARRRIDTVVLEAGGFSPTPPQDFGIATRQGEMHYRGAERGRSFGLGGTSVLWGGQMIPMTPGDVAARPTAGFDAWPVSYAELIRYMELVRHHLGLGRSPLINDARIVTARFPLLREVCPDFDLRLSEWIPFRSRNMAQAFAGTLARSDGPSVWLNAVATRVETRATANGHHVEAIHAASLADGRRTLRVVPRVLVVTAGALESTRFLLELDAAHDHCITRSGAPLGHYFADHLSVPCGRFHCRRWAAFNAAVAPVFEGSIMRSPRLELSPTAQARLGLPSAFAHVTFVTHGDTGFDVVRNWLRGRQGEERQLALTFGNLGRVIHDVSAMGTWRFLHKRLWIPRSAELLLQVDIEQTPNPDSRVYLTDEVDPRGRRRLAIDWRVQASDLDVIRSVVQIVVDGWRNSAMASLADIEPFSPATHREFQTPYDVYHPTGTIRMGHSAASSVVDSALKVWGFGNLHVSSTAVFPSAGSANPGITHLALTERLADRLAAGH
jgi:choline dehydrogenase-like flavoprotein